MLFPRPSVSCTVRPWGPDGCSAGHRNHRGRPRHPEREYDAGLAPRPLRADTASSVARPGGTWPSARKRIFSDRPCPSDFAQRHRPPRTPGRTGPAWCRVCGQRSRPRPARRGRSVERTPGGACATDRKRAVRASAGPRDRRCAWPAHRPRVGARDRVRCRGFHTGQHGSGGGSPVGLVSAAGPSARDRAGGRLRRGTGRPVWRAAALDLRAAGSGAIADRVPRTGAGRRAGRAAGSRVGTAAGNQSTWSSSAALQADELSLES